MHDIILLMLFMYICHYLEMFYKHLLSPSSSLLHVLYLFSLLFTPSLLGDVISFVFPLSEYIRFTFGLIMYIVLFKLRTSYTVRSFEMMPIFLIDMYTNFFNLPVRCTYFLLRFGLMFVSCNPHLFNCIQILLLTDIYKLLLCLHSSLRHDFKL